MNDLGTALVWSAAQVTLLGVAAAALATLIGRRSPATMARLAAASLGAAAVLTLVAICPLPAWWNWSQLRIARQAPVRSATEHETIAEPIPVAKGEPSKAERPQGLTWSLAAWRNVLLHLVQRAPEPSARPAHWPGLVAGAFLAGAGLVILRLVFGLWWVGHCRRCGRPVTDTALLTPPSRKFFVPFSSKNGKSSPAMLSIWVIVGAMESRSLPRGEISPPARGSSYQDSEGHVLVLLYQ